MQVKSSQVKSSQVKSSQVKSSQVKSSNIIFSLFLLLLLFSCADISNYKKDISFAFAPNFLASRASFPFLEDNTEVLCVAKLYTHGTNVDVLTQERTFRGTWSDLVNNHEFRFEDANVWCKGYVKVTVSYSYVEDSTGISEQKTVVLQGKSDTSSFIRGNLLLTVELENAPTTKVVLFRHNSIKLQEKSRMSHIVKKSDGEETNILSTGDYLEKYRFCFDDDGTLYAFVKNSSGDSNIKKSPDYSSPPFEVNITSTFYGIKADGKDIYYLVESDGTFNLVCLEGGSSTEKITIISDASDDFIDQNGSFAVFRGYVYIPFKRIEKRDDAPVTFYYIKRFAIPSINNQAAIESGVVDISPSRLGLEHYDLRDMHIQQGRLYILVDRIQELGDWMADLTDSRGGVIQVPLSNFENGINQVEPWANGEQVFGWYKDAGIPPDAVASRYFFGPVRFLARKPDELVIADDGASNVSDDPEDGYKYLRKRIVFLDLDTLSMNCVESSTSSTEYLWHGDHGSGMYYRNGY